MSPKYEILKKLIVMSGLKNLGKMSAGEIIALKKKQNAKAKIPVLKDSEVTVRKGRVMGFDVICMKQNSGTRRTLLYVIGGGMVRHPQPSELKQALKLAKETGLNVYVPYYPLCTDYPLTRAYEMIFGLYCKLLRRYGADNICVMGTSSGGNLALGLVPYIKENSPETPMPSRIVVLSPGVCPSTDEERARVKEIDKREIIISGDYLTTIEEILRHGSDDVPDYMIYLQNADFTGCPEVTFIYGSDEVLYAMAPSFEAAMKRFGVRYEMIVGQGMYHCYPVYPYVKEAKEGRRQLVDMLRQWKKNDLRDRLNDGIDTTKAV